MQVINRNEVPAFITKDKSEIREIMAPANSCIERQSLAEAIVYPGDTTTTHIHKTVEELYYILDGKGVMWQNGEEREVSGGDAIANPPGVPHRITNIGTSPLVFLCLCVPNYTHDDTELLE
jgi:mannose-6-phosphate isomerase-like protein (cupin superfamily)